MTAALKRVPPGWLSTCAPLLLLKEAVTPSSLHAPSAVLLMSLGGGGAGGERIASHRTHPTFYAILMTHLVDHFPFLLKCLNNNKTSQKLSSFTTIIRSIRTHCLMLTKRWVVAMYEGLVLWEHKLCSFLQVHQYRPCNCLIYHTGPIGGILLWHDGRSFRIKYVARLQEFLSKTDTKKSTLNQSVMEALSKYYILMHCTFFV